MNLRSAVPPKKSFKKKSFRRVRDCFEDRGPPESSSSELGFLIRSRCPSVRVLLREGGPSGVGRARLSVGLRLFSLTHTILSTLCDSVCSQGSGGWVSQNWGCRAAVRSLATIVAILGGHHSDKRKNWQILRGVGPHIFPFSAVVGAGQVIARLLPLFSSLPSGCYPHPSSARYASRRGAPFGRLGALSRCLPPARSRRSCLGRRGGSYRAVRARWHRLLRFASPHWHGEVALGLRRH